jgi:hypothetical protein
LLLVKAQLLLEVAEVTGCGFDVVLQALLFDHSSFVLVLNESEIGLKLSSERFEFLSGHVFVIEKSADLGCALEILFRKVIVGIFDFGLLFALGAVSVRCHGLLELSFIPQFLPVKLSQECLNLLFVLKLIMSQFVEMCLLGDFKLINKFFLVLVELFFI